MCSLTPSGVTVAARKIVRTAVRGVANSTTSRVVASKDTPAVVMTMKMTTKRVKVEPRSSGASSVAAAS
jgi:hypothetical protein